jgi:hypothetical protein
VKDIIIPSDLSHLSVNVGIKGAPEYFWIDADNASKSFLERCVHEYSFKCSPEQSWVISFGYTPQMALSVCRNAGRSVICSIGAVVACGIVLSFDVPNRVSPVIVSYNIPLEGHVRWLLSYRKQACVPPRAVYRVLAGLSLPIRLALRWQASQPCSSFSHCE